MTGSAPAAEGRVRQAVGDADEMTAELNQLRRNMWQLEQELRAAMSIMWDPSPTTGISVFDPAGVALEERRLRVRDAVARARAMVKHHSLVTRMNAEVLLKAQGGWYGKETSVEG